MLVSVLNGGHVGGINYVFHNLDSSIYLYMSYLCRVNVLH